MIRNKNITLAKDMIKTQQRTRLTKIERVILSYITGGHDDRE